MTKRPLILVFEDQDDEFERLSRLFLSLKFRVKRAATPEHFRDYTPFRGLRLIFIDLFFRQGNEQTLVGIELTEHVRKYNENIPIVVASNMEPARSDVADAFRAGASDYVDKLAFLESPGRTLVRVQMREGLEEEVRMESGLPLPVAFLFRDFRLSQMSQKRVFERMIELFEVILKLVTFSLLSGARDSLSQDLSERICRSLVQPSLGNLLNAVNHLREGKGFLKELWLVAQRKEFRRICSVFINLRNDYIGHGVRQEEVTYQDLVGEHVDMLLELLQMISVFEKWSLVVTFSGQALAEPERGYLQEMKIFRGSNPVPLVERQKVGEMMRPNSKRHGNNKVFLVSDDFENYVDLFPWVQYVVCEQRCKNEKLFFYRLARKGQLWLIDHVWGHTLQTSEGWAELGAILGDREGVDGE